MFEPGHEIMPHFSRYIFVILMALIAPAQFSYTAEITYKYSDLYDYDYGVSLNSEMSPVLENEHYELYEIGYDSVWGKRVEGRLMIPKKGVPPYPCLIYGHGYGADMHEAEAWYESMGEKEICVLSINGRYEKTYKTQAVDASGGYVFKLRDDVVSTIIDHRRAITFLSNRLELDTKSVVFMGRGLGGGMGIILMAMDERVSAAVMIGSWGGWTEVTGWGAGKELPSGGIEKYFENNKDIIANVMGPVEPLNYEGGIKGKPVIVIDLKREGSPENTSGAPNTGIKTQNTSTVEGTEGIAFYKNVAEWTKKVFGGEKTVLKGTEKGGEEKEGAEAEACAEHINHRKAMDAAEYYGYANAALETSRRLEVESFSRNLGKYIVEVNGINNVEMKIEVAVPREGQAPFPMMIFVHGENGDKRDMDMVAEVLAGRGIAVCAVEMYWKRSRGGEGKRGIKRQAVLEIRKMMDMMDMIADVRGREYIIMGEGVGAEIAIAVAYVDERIGALIVKDTERMSEREEEGAEMWMEEEMMRKLVNVRKLVIEVKKGEGGGESMSEILYGVAREPKESVYLDDSSNLVISGLLKGILNFSLGSGGVEMVRREYEDTKNVPVKNGILDMATGRNHLRGKSVGTNVTEIRVKEYMRGATKEIGIAARVRGVEEKNAAIVAVFESGKSMRRYVQLMDNGMGADPRVGDGEYAGIVRNAEVEVGKEYRIIVGGVGEAGGDIGGMEKVKTFVPE